MSLEDAFTSMTAATKRSDVQEPKRLSVQTPKRLSVEAAPLPLQGTAKSKHPEFQKVTIYVRKQTRKAAERKWEDESDGGDFSDLVEKLLGEYRRG